MAKWEYRKIDLNDPPVRQPISIFSTRQATEGWGLVVITANNIAYLKRQIPKPHAKRKT